MLLVLLLVLLLPIFRSLGRQMCVCVCLFVVCLCYNLKNYVPAVDFHRIHIIYTIHIAIVELFSLAALPYCVLLHWFCWSLCLADFSFTFVALLQKIIIKIYCGRIVIVLYVCVPVLRALFLSVTLNIYFGPRTTLSSSSFNCYAECFAYISICKNRAGINFKAFICYSSYKHLCLLYFHSTFNYNNLEFNFIYSI